MTRATRRGPWLPEEDDTLLQLVRSQGPNNWVRISQHMQHRSAKQCRERYHQNLKPSLNHEPISSQEGEMIEQMVLEMGKRWAEIARRLGNRSDNAVKNWWNGSMNRKKRHHTNGAQNQRNHVGPRSNPIPATRPRRPSQVQATRPRPDNHQTSQPYGWTGEGHQLRNAPPPPVQQHPELHQPMTTFGTYDPRILEAEPNTNLTTSGYTQSRENPTHHPPNLYPTSEPAPQISPPYPRSHPATQPPETSLVSPVGSEASRAASLRHAPSLISDNQSTYSISPRTISSPRPSMPAPIDTASHRGIWSEPTSSSTRRGSGPTAQHHRSSASRDRIHHHTEEGYVSTLLPPGANSQSKYYNTPPEIPPQRSYLTRSQQEQLRLGLNPLLTAPSATQHTARLLPPPLPSPNEQQSPSDLSPISARDTRMHVSHLLR